MAFIKKYAFQIAVSVLCIVMLAYLLSTYVFKKEEPLPIVMAAPQFSLTNIDGDLVTLENTTGKKRIVYFYFASCPDVCPPTTYKLAQLQETLRSEGRLGTEVELISITFDPEKDTDDIIRKFTEQVGAELDGWHFVRGESREQIIELAHAFDVSVIYDDVNETFIHMNPIILIDENNNIRGQVNGSPNELAGAEPFSYQQVYDALELMK